MRSARLLVAALCLLAAVACTGGSGSTGPRPAGLAQAVAGPTGSVAPAPALSTAPSPEAPDGLSPPPASAAPSAPSTPAPAFDPGTAAALQRMVDNSRDRIPTPGISVAIRLADGRSWAGVAGDRRLSPDRPVTPDTQFPIASITKTFVTAALMQLVDEGRLSLDDRLARWMPDFPRARQITLRELLSHTSGIDNYFENPRYNQRVFSDRSHRWSVREILGLVRGPYCRPGDCYHYSNTNFILLGRVLEKVTGKPLSQVIHERFVEPLGLAATVFQPDEPPSPNAAHGHLWGGGEQFFDQSRGQQALPHLSAVTVAWAAGAMASTPSDLAHWAEALYTGKVVSAERLAEMSEFRPRDEYGLGTRTRIFDGRRAIGHLGGIRGYEHAMWYFPREGATIVVLTNRGMFSTDKTVRLLARVLFSRIEAPSPEYDPSRNTH